MVFMRLMKVKKKKLFNAYVFLSFFPHKIKANLVQTIRQLYDKVSSAVCIKGIRVRQICALPSTFFNIILERRQWRITDYCQHWSKETHKPAVCRRHCLAWRKCTRKEIIQLLSQSPIQSGMEISAEKPKLMRNKPECIQDSILEISVRAKLRNIIAFKFLGSTVSDESSKFEVLHRTAQATSALAKLNRVPWNRTFLSGPRWD